MRALVTGGAGFIGSHLVDQLVGNGYDVRIYDNLSSGKLSFLEHLGDGIEFIKADLLDLEKVKEALQDIDVVFHMAANPDIRLGTEITDTDLEQGTIATYNVLEAMRLSGVNKIAFASSSVVYGEATQMPTSEDYGPCLPISLYGASKIGSEGLITSWVGTFEFQAWIYRFANIVGSRGTHGVIYDFIHKLKRDPERLEVLGDGHQEKSYMEVRDCARAMIHLFETQNESINVHNLGTGDTCSVRMIAKEVVAASGISDVEIHYTGGERGWAGDVPRAWLDVDKLFATGFTPTMLSHEAIQHTADVLSKDLGLKA